MNSPVQLVADIWEGNDKLQPDVLKQNGVTGMIVRLNDMAGGHHMDARFEPDWSMAQEFLVNAIYFVYNPWVDGAVNLAWLMAHLPENYNRRVLLDVEVRYPGYSPAMYAKELANFVSQCKLPLTIYTGEWFLEIVASWPTNVSYWWAAYPNLLKGVAAWSQVETDLQALSYQAFTAKAPANVELWQCIGDNPLLPGFGGQKGDVSVFPGTLSDLQAWLGSGPIPVSASVAPQEFQPYQATVTAFIGLRVHSAAGVQFTQVGSLPYKTKVMVVEVE